MAEHPKLGLSKNEIAGFFADYAAKKLLAAESHSYNVIPHPSERVLAYVNADGTVIRQYFSYAAISKEDFQAPRLPDASIQDPSDKNTFHSFLYCASLTFKKTGRTYKLRGASQFGEDLYSHDGSATKMEERLSFPDSIYSGSFNFLFRRTDSSYLYGSFDINGRLTDLRFHNGKNNELEVSGRGLRRILQGKVINTARWVGNTRQEYLVGIAKDTILLRRTEEGCLLDVIILPMTVSDTLISENLLNPELVYNPTGKHPMADEQFRQMVLEHQIEGFMWNRIPPEQFASFVKILP